MCVVVCERGVARAGESLEASMASRFAMAYHGLLYLGRGASEAASSRVVEPAATWAEAHAFKERTVRVTQTLLERVGGGDAEAVRECIDRFSGLIWSLARRAGLMGAEAEDSVQEIFVEIWKSAGRYRPEIASETAFVATIARRRLIDARRRSTRRPAPQALGEETAGRPISDRAEVMQEAARAAKALEQLSAEQQRVLRMSVFEGLSHEKIATATGLPLGTVKTHARRGLIRIRAMLGVTGDGAGGTSAAEGQDADPRSESKEVAR
jgi:RNA polymerase sigma-70 factor (ECF subfamily)